MFGGRCPVRVSEIERHRLLREFFDQWASGSRIVMGFGITETCRDEMTMTGFCPEVSARPTMSVPRPRHVCSRPGQGRWSTSPWLAISGEGMLDDAFPYPFPAAQPASASTGRDEDVHSFWKRDHVPWL